MSIICVCVSEGKKKTSSGDETGNSRAGGGTRAEQDAQLLLIRSTERLLRGLQVWVCVWAVCRCTLRPTWGVSLWTEKGGGASQQRVKHPAGGVTARRRQEAKVEPRAAGRKWQLQVGGSSFLPMMTQRGSRGRRCGFNEIVGTESSYVHVFLLDPSCRRGPETARRHGNLRSRAGDDISHRPVRTAR